MDASRVVILPTPLLPARVYQPLAAALRAQGCDVDVAPPAPAYH
ncbi:hypothetical protein [Tessaracoccus palaemonis]|nr:hypothetical protein [Tessaracoccus palaemonis]